ncbi:hypothetical protein [Thiorhodococcus minor]|nr:hypothetical protein [Thiorhodococcus minor]
MIALSALSIVGIGVSILLSLRLQHYAILPEQGGSGEGEQHGSD